MKKILVVTVNWLGDSILTTPIFKALHKNYPESYIAVMAVPRVKDIFSANPYINEVIIFDEKKENKSLISKLKFIRQLHGKKFDTVFLIHRSFTRALICWLAGIKRRIGYKRFKTNFILTDKILPVDSRIHRGDYYLKLLEGIGITINDRLPEVFIPKEIEEEINKFITSLRNQYKYIIGINSTANWDLKRWPEIRFSQLAQELKIINSAVIFIGADKDKEYINKVLKAINLAEHCYNFSGKTNLLQLAALIKGMDLFISNDSGPAHLSGALNIPTLVLFGPTDPQITGPRGKFVEIIHKDINCNIPCYKLDCTDNKCMQAITLEDVMQKIKILLKL